MTPVEHSEDHKKEIQILVLSIIVINTCPQPLHFECLDYQYSWKKGSEALFIWKWTLCFKIFLKEMVI